MCYKGILCFTVILFIKSTITSEFDQIIDFTSECKNLLKTDYFLTHGMGFVDSTVLTINAVNKNCSIRFHTDSVRLHNTQTNILQIIVIESTKRKQELKTNQSTISLLSNNKLINISNDFNAQKVLYVNVFDSNTTTIILNGASPALKITATSARVPNNAPCVDNEIRCRIDNYTMCMNVELLCDGNINCGNPNYYDEAPTLCQPEMQVKFFGFLMTCIVVIAFVIAAFAKCVSKIIPKIPKKPLRLVNQDMIDKKSKFRVYHQPIKMTQMKNPRVVVNYCRNIDSKPLYNAKQSTALTEEEVQSHLYSAGKLYQANQKMIKRITTNSPVIRNPRKSQYVKQTFGRDILFLADGEGKRHRVK